MPRLFTALEIPADIGLALSLKRGGLPGARWIDPENYHITLSFIGDVAAATARDVTDALDQAGGGAPIPISFDHLDAFGGDRPRALFARVRADPALLDLKAHLDTALMRGGVQPERRKFVPHVTLARLRGASAPAVAGFLQSSRAIASLGFTASRFVLLSSRPSMGGGPYACEQVYDLDSGYGAYEDEADEYATWP